MGWAFTVSIGDLSLGFEGEPLAGKFMGDHVLLGARSPGFPNDVALRE
jgi:hypothetical protein